MKQLNAENLQAAQVCIRKIDHQHELGLSPILCFEMVSDFNFTADRRWIFIESLGSVY